MRFRITFFWLLLLLVAQAALWGNEPAAPRLAIVSEAEVRNLAGLLTATLSKAPGVEVLERDDLKKLADEKKLSPSLDLREITGIEGILFLSKNGDEVRARLTAVKLGFALFDLVFLPNAPPEEISSKIESQLQRLSGKLLIPREKAIPLSILNLRAEEANKEGARVERDLTLLLEVQLAHLPEVLVLERRQAGSIAFERGLHRELPDLLRGAFLIDGMIKRSPQQEAISVALSVRTPGSGELQEIKGEGKAGDLPALARDLTANLATILKATPSHDPLNSAAEAREYFQEGLWAHRNHLYREAIAALDSAEVLGETAPDLFATRGFAACHQFTGKRIWQNNRNQLKSPPGPDEGLALIQRAMDDEAAFRRAGGKKKFQTDLIRSPNYSDGELQIQVAMVASLFLEQLEKGKHPLRHELRRLIREFIDFDLAGKGSIHYLIIKDAPLWAYNKEELIEYYVRFLNRNPIKGNSLQIWIRPDNFCERFIPQVEDRRKAYFDFVEKLSKEPGTRVRGLLFQAQQTSGAEQNRVSRELYEALWEQRTNLLKTNQLGYLLKYCFSLEEKRKVGTADPTLLKAFQYYLENATPKTTFFSDTWTPALFSKNAAPALWEAMKGYQARILEKKPKTNFNGINSEFARYFKELCESKPTYKTLHLDQFWSPPDTDEDRFCVTHYYPTAKGLRLIGTQGKNAPEVCDVSLPNMETQRYPLGLSDHLTDLFSISDDRLLAIGTRGGEHPSRYLAISNPGDQAWTTYEIRNDAEHLHPIGGKIYYTFGSGFTSESGISIFAPETGVDTLVTNSRRRPAKNQFEDRKGYFIKALFENANGEAVAALDGKAHVISERPGDWPSALEFLNIKSQRRYGNKTYLHASIYLNERIHFMIVMIEPGKPEPELWYSELPMEITELPKYGKLPEWAIKPRWRAEPGSSHYETQYAVQGEVLFQYTGNRRERELLLRVFRKDQPTPASFNLAFSTPHAMTRYGGKGEDSIFLSHSIARLFTTQQGICFWLTFSGFWFISFEELQNAEKG